MSGTVITRSPPNDGRAWIDEPRGADRVFRGGSWFNVAHACRAAIRMLVKRCKNFIYGRVGIAHQIPPISAVNDGQCPPCAGNFRFNKR